MATTKLKIRNDLAKKSGGAPTVIYVQYTFKGKTKLFNTGKKIDPALWDEQGQCVKRAYRGYTTLNDFIKKRKLEVDDIVIDAQRRKIDPTLEYVEQQYQLLSAMELPETSKDFFKLFNEFIEGSQSKLAYNTIKQLKRTVNHLKAYETYSKKKLTFDTIGLEFHDKFTNYLIREKNHSPNTIGGVIKNLKIFMGKMTEIGINTNLAFQHKSFNKPSAPVDLIALTQHELDLLYNADLSKNSRLNKVRDLFVFGCVTGMRFSDMINLKPENIKPDIIDFVTLKTRDRLTIPLIPYARAILAKYEGALPEVMSNQKMNGYLKELCQLCGINDLVQKVRYIGSSRIESKAPKHEMVSTHTARRTFITLALERGTRPEIVMRITGHKDIKTMMRYVRLTDKATHNEFLRPFNDGNMKVVG